MDAEALAAASLETLRSLAMGGRPDEAAEANRELVRRAYDLPAAAPPRPATGPDRADGAG